MRVLLLSESRLIFGRPTLTLSWHFYVVGLGLAGSRASGHHLSTPLRIRSFLFVSLSVCLFACIVDL